jgi:predicted acyltransferase
MEKGMDAMDALTGEHAGTRATGRMSSLDVFRGLTIAGMILVNNPGTWDAIYSPLEHSKWDGLTPTDLVFPFFLFIVGVSITLALARRADVGGSKRDLYLKIVRRTVIIFALGLVLTAFPYNDLAAFRIPGVLQRIAVCYLLRRDHFLEHTLARAGVDRRRAAFALLGGDEVNPRTRLRRGRLEHGGKSRRLR